MLEILFLKKGKGLQAGREGLSNAKLRTAVEEMLARLSLERKIREWALTLVEDHDTPNTEISFFCKPWLIIAFKGRPCLPQMKIVQCSS